MKGIDYTCWGETKNVLQWSKDHRCKISYEALGSRLKKGIDIEKALTESKGGCQTKFKIDDKFNRLTLKEILPGKWNKGKKFRRKAKFLCDCGNSIIIILSAVTNGHTRSCGCLKKETIGNISRTHGYTDTGLIEKLYGAIKRCYKVQNSKYMAYGGRGIRVCDEWRNDYQSFIDWALENGWNGDSSLELDRKDENWHYCPENCRLATKEEGLISRKNNRPLLAWGEVKSVLHWSKDERCNMDIEGIQNRLTLGWSTEDAIYMPYPS